jgi:hypothetical protein
MKNRKRKLVLCLLVPLLGSLIPLACDAFEQALYSPKASSELVRSLTQRLSGLQLSSAVITNYAKWASLAHTVFYPSCSLHVKSLDIIELKTEPNLQHKEQSSSFTRNQIMELLRNNQKKDLLAVRLEAGGIFDSKNKKMLADLEPFIDKLNFKRVIIVANDGPNFYVYLDKQDEDDAPLYHNGATRPECITHPNVVYMRYPDDSELFSVTAVDYREDFVERSALRSFFDKDPGKELIVFQIPKIKAAIDLAEFVESLGYKKAELVKHEYNLFQVEPTVVDETPKRPTGH